MGPLGRQRDGVDDGPQDASQHNDKRDHQGHPLQHVVSPRTRLRLVGGGHSYSRSLLRVSNSPFPSQWTYRKSVQHMKGPLFICLSRPLPPSLKPVQCIHAALPILQKPKRAQACRSWSFCRAWFRVPCGCTG